MEYMNMPFPIRNRKRLETRQLTEKFYNWDNITKLWENYFDQLEFRADWSTSLNKMDRPQKPKDDKENIIQIINMCNDYIKNADLLSSAKFLSMLQSADYGFTYASPTQISNYSIDNVYDYVNTMIDNNNISEEARASAKSIEEDFIQYAHLKSNT